MLESKKEGELKRTLLLLLNKSIVRRIAACKSRRRRSARPHQVAWPRRTTAAAGATRKQALRRTAAQESWRRRRGRALRNGALLGDRAPPLGRGGRRRGREVRHRGPVPEDELIKEPDRRKNGRLKTSWASLMVQQLYVSKIFNFLKVRYNFSWWLVFDLQDVLWSVKYRYFLVLTKVLILQKKLGIYAHRSKYDRPTDLK